MQVFKARRRSWFDENPKTDTHENRNTGLSVFGLPEQGSHSSLIVKTSAPKCTSLENFIPKARVDIVPGHLALQTG